jgi:hypothetical protein
VLHVRQFIEESTEPIIKEVQVLQLESHDIHLKLGLVNKVSGSKN